MATLMEVENLVRLLRSKLQRQRQAVSETQAQLAAAEALVKDLLAPSKAVK